MRAPSLVGLALAFVIGVFATPAANASAVATQRLSCLTPAAISTVKRDASAFATLYGACAAELRAALGPDGRRLGASAMRLAFASVVAHELADYGPSGVYDLDALLRQSRLDCAGYAALAWQLARSAGADVRDVEIVGWDGGTVGNHAQLAVTRAGQQLILDPTIGLVAFADIDDVENGASVDGADMVVFSKDDDTLATFTDMVTSSLYLGSFRADQVIYTQPYPPGQGALYAAALALRS